MKSRLIVLYIFLFISIEIVAQPHEKLRIENITNNFYVYTTYKEFKGNLISANGMYFITSEGVVIFDTPWDTTQLKPLLDSIQAKHQKNVIICIATHSHEDRTGGLDVFRQQNIKTFTTQKTDSISKIQHEKRAEFILEHDTTFIAGNTSFHTYYPGEGHTSDNIVIWIEKEKILYGGCFIKSTEAVDLGNTNDANVIAWKSSIKNVQQKFPNPNYIITGHQNWRSLKSLSHTLKLIKKHIRKHS